MEGVERMEALVFGEINAERVLQVQSALAIAAGHKRPVRVWICSMGGDVGAALALYDLFRRRPDVEVIATGECQSAALIAFLGAHQRRATPNVIFLNHAITGDAGMAAMEFPAGLKMPAIEVLKTCPQGFFDVSDALETEVVHGIFQGDAVAAPRQVGVN